jgi:RNA polymerase sigma-70 factor (ECF subfamily)
MSDPVSRSCASKDNQQPRPNTFVAPASKSVVAANASSFSALFETYQAMLIVTLRTRGLEYHEIDDVCQEVWVKAWHHLESGRALDRPAGWLRRVAMNLVYSSKRRRQQIPASQLAVDSKDGQLFKNLADESGGDAKVDSPTADIDTHRRDAIRSCLDALPKIDGDIVTRVYAGLKPREIAADLSIDANSLYTKKHRALERFKHCLEGKVVPT